MIFNKFKKKITHHDVDGEMASSTPNTTNRPEWKKSILNDFTKWLDQVDEEQRDNIIADLNVNSDADILTLIGETTALRQEVKLMGRSSGKLLGAVEEVATTVSERVIPLVDQFQSYESSTRLTNERNILRPLLLELGDLSASISEALQQFPEPKRPWYIPRHIKNIPATEQQQLILKTLGVRINSILQRYNVNVVAELNMKFNPLIMTAVGTSTDGKVDIGCVSDIVKQGFLIVDEVLRTAQVIIEKE